MRKAHKPTLSAAWQCSLKVGSYGCQPIKRRDLAVMLVKRFQRENLVGTAKKTAVDPAVALESPA
jgi:hypothetical protein